MLVILHGMLIQPCWPDFTPVNEGSFSAGNSSRSLHMGVLGWNNPPKKVGVTSLLGKGSKWIKNGAKMLKTGPPEKPQFAWKFFSGKCVWMHVIKCVCVCVCFCLFLFWFARPEMMVCFHGAERWFTITVERWLWPAAVFCSTNQPHPSCHQGAKRPRQHNIGRGQSSTLYTVQSQTLKACWPCHMFQALLEKWSKSQTLKAFGPCHVVQVLIEISSKSQTLKACWPCHIVQALIELGFKSQTLKACWPSHVVQVLIEISIKSQTL